LLSGVSSVSTRDTEGPGCCGSWVFITEEVDGVGDKGSGDTTMVDVKTLGGLFKGLPDLGLFCSAAEESGFPEYLHPH
jgi:hypothetical protein